MSAVSLVAMYICLICRFDARLADSPFHLPSIRLEQYGQKCVGGGLRRVRIMKMIIQLGFLGQRLTPCSFGLFLCVQEVDYPSLLSI
jgi:hypothetical protein